MSTGADEAVVVWGEVLWDRFPDGDQLGGAPANVAWHLGQAGGWVQLVTRVGADDLGRRAIDRLAAWVDTSLIQVDPERATGEVGVALLGGEPRYTLHPGRAWERIACPPPAATAIAEAGVLIYGTLAQRTADGLVGWRDAIRAAGARCLKVCDVNLRRASSGAPAVGDDNVALVEAIAAADVIKLNDQELAAIAAWRGWRDPIVELRAGRRTIALTHGEAGSTLYGDGAPVRIAGVRAAPGGDNVGCGDAYLAILVHGMTLGWDLATSGAAASRYAAAVAGVRGATPVFDDAALAALLELE